MWITSISLTNTYTFIKQYDSTRIKAIVVPAAKNAASRNHHEAFYVIKITFTE